MKKILAAVLAAILTVSSAAAAAAAEAPKRGDVNLDGKVDVTDATTVQKICAGLGTYSDEQLGAADANRSGSVDIVDATYIQRLAAGIIQPDDPQPEPLTPEEINAQGNAAVCNFSAELLKTGVKSGSNTFVSPLSVMMALSMTANGANGTTLSEMEAALGAKRDVLNAYFKNYIENSEGFGKTIQGRFPGEEEIICGGMEIADSIWYNNDGTHSKLNPTFVSDTLNYYYSDVFAAPFNQETCDAMNAWVKEKTHGMIPKLTDKISPQALLYLVNTIAFEGNWDEPYDKYQVFSGTFTAEDGETFPVEMMNSTEDIYLRDGDAADGFLKYYEGSRYAFAAFLPKEGTTLEGYVKSLTGERLAKALKRDNSYDFVRAYLPKFDLEYNDSLVDNLQAMGMTSAFDPEEANFLRMVEAGAPSSPFISDVLHKTVIQLDENGTKAAAVTAVIMAESAVPGHDEPRGITICLDRPFVYLIVDTVANTPVFIGTMESFS